MSASTILVCCLTVLVLRQTICSAHSSVVVLGTPFTGALVQHPYFSKRTRSITILLCGVVVSHVGTSTLGWASTFTSMSQPPSSSLPSSPLEHSTSWNSSTSNVHLLSNLDVPYVHQGLVRVLVMGARPILVHAPHLVVSLFWQGMLLLLPLSQPNFIFPTWAPKPTSWDGALATLV